MQTAEKIERTALRNLIHNEDYTRKVLPFLKSEYFQDRSERVVFSEIQKFISQYNKRPTKETLQIDLNKRRVEQAAKVWAAPSVRPGSSSARTLHGPQRNLDKGTVRVFRKRFRPAGQSSCPFVFAPDSAEEEGVTSKFDHFVRDVSCFR